MNTKKLDKRSMDTKIMELENTIDDLHRTLFLIGIGFALEFIILAFILTEII